MGMRHVPPFPSADLYDTAAPPSLRPPSGRLSAAPVLGGRRYRASSNSSAPWPSSRGLRSAAGRPSACCSVSVPRIPPSSAWLAVSVSSTSLPRLELAVRSLLAWPPLRLWEDDGGDALVTSAAPTHARTHFRHSRCSRLPVVACSRLPSSTSTCACCLGTAHVGSPTVLSRRSRATTSSV